MTHWNHMMRFSMKIVQVSIALHYNTVCLLKTGMFYVSPCGWCSGRDLSQILRIFLKSGNFITVKPHFKTLHKIRNPLLLKPDILCFSSFILFSKLTMRSPQFPSDPVVEFLSSFHSIFTFFFTKNIYSKYFQ